MNANYLLQAVASEVAGLLGHPVGRQPAPGAAGSTLGAFLRAESDGDDEKRPKRANSAESTLFEPQPGD
eukprot:7058298-Alexandrium_andersonii.AAC.1